MTHNTGNRWSRSRLLLLPPLLAALAVTGVVAASECAETDSQALQWLDKMSRSLRQVSYEGVVTLQRGGEMQVMQVSHSVDGASSFERMTELTGQGAQVERHSHPMDCVHPGDQLLRIGALLQEGRCGIAEQYRFTVADGERIAGRNAVNIRIEPRDMYRFGYSMALDRETGLLLKMQTISHGNQTLETMQFAHLTYTDTDTASPASQVAVIHAAQHPQSGGETTGTSVARPWKVGWLPRGFAATDSQLGVSGRRTYTDGLAVFSVFMEELDREIRPGEGLVRQGGTTTYTRGMRLADQPVLVTVIGEVPVNTARMVADSVSWEQ
ncbi:MAG: MucB/RseB C-terminal domain-containing protein [Halioglobus sp.]